MSPLKPLSDSSPRFWRTLEEFEGDPAFLEAMTREFPLGASMWHELENPVSRRRFLKLMGASAALAGLAACTKMPPERIIPYVVSPEALIPGKPRFYATAGSFCGYSKSLLAESHEGRPTKLEGNPRHPSALGKSDIFMQAELLALYDPDRAQTVRERGEISTWSAFTAAILAESARWSTDGGEGVRILTQRVTSPTLLGDIRRFLARHPKARWHAYEPTDPGQLALATGLVYGQTLRPVYDFARARVVLSLDHDFLGPGPAQEAYSRAFVSGRQAARFNRLYVIESSVSATGACADHRWPVKPSQLHGMAQGLASYLGVPGARPPAAGVSPPWLSQIASDLRDHSGDGLVICGEDQPLETQALVFAINEHLGNTGKSMHFFPDPDGGRLPGPAPLPELTDDMLGGKVRTLFILGANAAYDTPATLRFAEGLHKVRLRSYLGKHADETAELCDWLLPDSHFLETWGDGRSLDGTITLQQPLISPLYETRSAIELFSILLGEPGRTARQAVIDTHHLGDASRFDLAFSDGFLAGTALRPPAFKMISTWFRGLPALSPPVSPRPALNAHELEATIRPDPTIWDGRYANNAWLQELPKPLLQLTWGNAMLLSPETARQLSLEDEDEVELRAEDRVQRASVLRVPGHPDGSATLFLGYGRTRAGEVGNGLGYNAFALQDHRSPGFIPKLLIKKLGTQSSLALTHAHSSMEGRDLVVHGELEQFRQHPESIVREDLRKNPASLLPDRPSPAEAWAMSINLNSCIGCNTCAIACQAENNIPVVGKDQVRRSREMHWIRVDRYFQGNPANPQVFFQPVPCMHCEKAPCEEVCPTAATNHSHEGLNQMIYNRCVGTRYCSNNCPYKVRRFNFLEYSDTRSTTAQLMHNPDVTVRSRGVMEKCTYCIQRIQVARIDAELEGRRVRDGEILTACQQACPTDAIIFGDQNDPQSRVATLKRSPLNYRLLNELGTLPRTTYLARIRNPNPNLPRGEV